MYPKFTNRIWSLHALLQPFKLFTKMLHVSTLANTQSIWDSLNADHSSQHFALLTRCDVTSGCGFKKLHDYSARSLCRLTLSVTLIPKSLLLAPLANPSVYPNTHASYTQCCQEYKLSLFHLHWICADATKLNDPISSKSPARLAQCTPLYIDPTPNCCPEAGQVLLDVSSTPKDLPHQSHSSRHKWAHRNWGFLEFWDGWTKMLHMTQCPTSSDHSKSFKDPSHLKLITKYVWCPIVTFNDPPGITAGYGHSTSGLIHASAELHTRKRALSHGVLATPANLSIWRWEAQLKQRFSHWQRVTYESLRLNDTLPHTPQKHT